MYYWSRLRRAPAKPSGGVSTRGRYGGATNKAMAELYKNPQFRKWQTRKSEPCEEECDDDDFEEEWRGKEQQLFG